MSFEMDPSDYVKEMKENLVGVRCCAEGCYQEISEWDRDTRSGVCAECYWGRGPVNNMVFLRSVGTFFDTQTRVTYWAGADEEPSFASAMHLSNIRSQAWFDCLSEEDRKVTEGHNKALA